MKSGAVRWGIWLALLTVLAVGLGVSVGSDGWSPFWLMTSSLPGGQQIVLDIRLPRTVGAWAVGGLLGLSGAVAQGLFRNPLADPYLLGSSAGAALGVAMFLVAIGGHPAALGGLDQLGMTGAAFVGAMAAVVLTLSLAKGVQHTLRLLLAGVVVGVVLGAFGSLTMLMVPDIMRAMQAFMLGTTGFLGWDSVWVMAPILLLTMLVAMAAARYLDALGLGEHVAQSLGVPLAGLRVALVLVLALATGGAVAHAGLIAFVGLVSPHLVRSRVSCTHGPLIVLSVLVGGLLLLLADVLARWMLAPQELPVGVLTAVLGGSYLLWRMHRS